MYEMIEENNKMLKKLIKKGRWAIFFKGIRYIIIIITIIGSWYYTKPFIDQIKELYIKVNDTTESISELKSRASSTLDFSKLFNKE